MQPLNVLIVDDSPLALKKLEAILAGLGHKVVGSANNGAVACEAYAKFAPDIVTMDITMPDMDGVEAARRIIAADAKAKIIMVTSHGQEAMVLDALKAGVKGYIVKPVKADKLAAMIDKVAAA
jgi:two-component system chemotaxis response regulator CheY